MAVYLGGSFATGDFMEGASDYDLLVVTARELGDDEVARLRDYHERLAREDPRSLLLEGDYAPLDALVPEGTRRPAWWFRRGELRSPEHMLSADNIANMRDAGIVLFGPPPSELLPAVTAEHVRAAVREMLAEEPDLSTESSAARELLGMARSLAALQTGRPTSHAAGLSWALDHVEERWRGALRRAAQVRAGAPSDEHDEVLRRAARAWRAHLGLTTEKSSAD